MHRLGRAILVCIFALALAAWAVWISSFRTPPYGEFFVGPQRCMFAVTSGTVHLDNSPYLADRDSAAQIAQNRSNEYQSAKGWTPRAQRQAKDSYDDVPRWALTKAIADKAVADEKDAAARDAAARRDLAKFPNIRPWAFESRRSLPLIGLLAMLPPLHGLQKWIRRPSAGYCVVCRYNLSGNLSGVCPECGTGIRG